MVPIPVSPAHTLKSVCVFVRVRMVDLLVGAPLFMDRGSDGKLREVGQVGETSSGSQT